MRMAEADFVPLRMQGVSMCPWLRPGDVLLVDRACPEGSVRVGDVVVLEQVATDARIAHRVIRIKPGSETFVTKGDRNVSPDERSEGWKFSGLVRGVWRRGEWRRLRFGGVLAWVSRGGLYPGQRIPAWACMANLRRVLGVRRADKNLT